jgi:putative peptidoglycan lipid II flippase
VIAQRLMQMPNGIFATAIVIAMFPTLSAQAARGEMDAFKQSMSLCFRTILFVMIPSAVGMAVLRTPIIRVLYQRGLFDSGDTEAAAAALLYYCVGLCAYGGIQVLNRAFYAMQDTWTPVSVGVVSVAVNITLSVALLESMAHAGLALAYSLAGILNLLILFLLLRRKAGHFGGRRIFRSFFKTALIASGMGLAVWRTAGFFETHMDMGSQAGQVIQVAVSIGLGTAVFWALARLFHIEEGQIIADMLWRRFKRRKRQSR